MTSGISWASVAAMNGVGMVTIAKLLGHALVETTAGYAHLADGHLVETVEKVGSLIANAMKLQNTPPATSTRALRRYGRWI